MRAEQTALTYQFAADGGWYFKSAMCASLDVRYGDISSQIKDVECKLVRLLEKRLLAWLPMLQKAQLCLAELDALLSLAVCARDLNLVRPLITEDVSTLFLLSYLHKIQTLVKQCYDSQKKRS